MLYLMTDINVGIWEIKRKKCSVTVEATPHVRPENLEISMLQQNLTLP